MGQALEVEETLGGGAQRFPPHWDGGAGEEGGLRAGRGRCTGPRGPGGGPGASPGARLPWRQSVTSRWAAGRQEGWGEVRAVVGGGGGQAGGTGCWLELGDDK